MSNPYTGLSEYELRNLPAHLVGAAFWAEVEALLTDLVFLEAKAESGLAFDLTGDLAEGSKALPAHSSGRQVLVLLNAALRADIQFVAKRPTTLFQCLWNRCWWYDCPEAARHYEAPQDGWPAPGPPWESSGVGLYRLLERWRSEKETRAPRRLWLRSVRPSDTHLASRQRAVIHTRSKGRRDQQHVQFSPDSLLVGDGIDWWDVQTGRKVRKPERELTQELPSKSPPDRAVGEPVAVSPDGQTVLVVGEDAAFHVLDGASRNALATTPSISLIQPPLPPRLAYLADMSDMLTFRRLTQDMGTVLKKARVVFGPDGLAFAAHGEVAWSPWENGHGYWGVWETSTGAVIVPLQQFEYAVNVVVFSPDGRYVALAAGDSGDGVADVEHGQFMLWDLRKKEAVVRHGPGGDAYTTGVAFSPLGDRVFAWGGVADGDWDYGPARGHLGVWETTTGRQLCFQDGGDRSVWCFALSAEGSRFAVGLADGRVGLGDYHTFEMQLLTGNLSVVRSIAFSPNGELVASLGGDGTIRLLDLTASSCDPGRLREQTRHLARVHFSDDGTRAVSKCSHHSVWVWDVGTGEVVATPRPHGVTVMVGPEPQFFFGGRSLVVESGELCVMDAASGEITRQLSTGKYRQSFASVALGHRQDMFAAVGRDESDDSADRRRNAGRIEDLHGNRPAVQLEWPDDLRADVVLTFSADDRWLAAQASAEGLIVFDTTTGKRRFSLPGPGPFLFSPDSRYVLVAGAEPLRLWEVESAREVARQPLSAYWTREAISPDGRLRATFSDAVTVIDLGTGREVCRLEGHEPDGTELAFTRDSGFLLTLDKGSVIRLWNLATGQEVASNERRDSRNKGRDSKPIIRQAGGATKVRHPATGEDIASLRHGRVRGAAFDQDGRRVVFVTQGGSTRIWDISRGRCSVLARKPFPVDAVVSGHRYLAVAGKGETVIIDSATAKEVAWLPLRFDTTSKSFASGPCGFTWCGGRENRFYLFSLECHR